jgi:hypothetical protein
MHAGLGRYANGQKRCQICDIFMEWDGLWCPCCGYRLRTRPRSLKYKAKLRARSKNRDNKGSQAKRIILPTALEKGTDQKKAGRID